MLTLVELLFSLPASNDVVERVFSQMNVIKTKKRSLLSNKALDDLLTITSAHIPLKDFCPDDAIDLWWKKIKYVGPNRNQEDHTRKQSALAQLQVLLALLTQVLLLAQQSP